MFVYPLLLDNESVHNHFHFQHLNNDNYIETFKSRNENDLHLQQVDICSEFSSDSGICADVLFL